MFFGNVYKQIDKVKVVSFDIFDTLLLRPYLNPSDLFKHIGKIHSLPNYYQERIEAETIFYNKNGGSKEASIDDIYSVIPQYKDIKQIELNMEYQVSSSDLYFPENIFQNEAEHSYYLSVFIKGKTNQRSLTLDNTDRIIKTNYGGENTWITFGGQAFFTESLSKKLIGYIEPVYDKPEYSNKYWVDFQDEHLEDMPMWIKRVNNIVEFNTLGALRNFDKTFSAVNISKTMKFLCNKLNTEENELYDFEPLKSGNSAIGCTFKFGAKNFSYNHTTKQIEDLR